MLEKPLLHSKLAWKQIEQNAIDTLLSPEGSDTSASSSSSTTTTTAEDTTVAEQSVFSSLFECKEELDDRLLDIDIVNLTCDLPQSVFKETVSEITYNTVITAREMRPAILTKECCELLKRITNCQPTFLLLRKELMNYAEFSDGSVLDPYLHNDYDFTHDTLFHFLKSCESPINPISQRIRERTAATWTKIPIINNLFLQYQDIIEIKWLEVLHDDLDGSKVDGLGLKRDGRSLVIILELAGGIDTNTEIKLESDCMKTYNNALKSLKNNNKEKVFVVLYHENVIYFESLMPLSQHYVRKRHLELRMPQTPRDLKSFAASLPDLFSWRQSVIDFSL